MPRRAILYFSAALLILAVAIGSYSLLMRAPPGSSGSGEALVGGPFSLTDQTGKRVSDKDFLGRYMLVFFGYTYCPDVCPTELQVMTAALDSMGAEADRIQPVFITIDPERDTPEVLKSLCGEFRTAAGRPHRFGGRDRRRGQGLPGLLCKGRQGRW